MRACVCVCVCVCGSPHPQLNNIKMSRTLKHSGIVEICPESLVIIPTEETDCGANCCQDVMLESLQAAGRRHGVCAASLRHAESTRR